MTSFCDDGDTVSFSCLSSTDGVVTLDEMTVVDGKSVVAASFGFDVRVIHVDKSPSAGRLRVGCCMKVLSKYNIQIYQFIASYISVLTLK